MGDPQVSLHDFLESHFVPGGLCYANYSYLNKPPGSFCTYSNPGASLAGYLVESVVDSGFSVFCNESIFNLLDMPNSRWYYSELDTSDVAMIYTWNGSNLIPHGFRSWVDYPCAEVKSNVNELSNYLKMYLNYGIYNGNRILDSTTVELMTTVYDTIAIWGIPIGLIWWHSPPPYNMWSHNGARGALIFFNKEEKWGGVLVGNGGQYEDELAAPLVEYAMRFSEFAISSLRTIDNDRDGILEYGETIELEIGLSNNLSNNAENVTATLHCNDPCFQLLDSVAMLGSIAAGQSVLNLGQPFRFKVREMQEPHPVSMDMQIQYNSNKIDIIHFQLYAGRADLLLVKDERDVYQSERFYLEVLDSLGYRTHYWDLAVNGIPDSTFLSGFPAVIWYTGYDEDNTISEASQMSLINYLDQGGRLFMTGQNISDEIGSTFFSNYYLRANHVDNTNSVEITGMNADPVSQGLHFTLNGGTGLWNQYSQSILLPVNGGSACFQYAGQDCAGVRPDDSYQNQTVFLGFGFEGITEWADRYTLMQRILEYFGVYVDIEENMKADDDLSEIHLIPNPASQAVIISYTLSRSQDITILVHNLLGKEVLKETSGHGLAGKKSINLKLPGLEAGIYIVSVQGEKERRTAKLVVSK